MQPNKQNKPETQSTNVKFTFQSNAQLPQQQAQQMPINSQQQQSFAFQPPMQMQANIPPQQSYINANIMPDFPMQIPYQQQPNYIFSAPNNLNYFDNPFGYGAQN